MQTYPYATISYYLNRPSGLRFGRLGRLQGEQSIPVFADTQSFYLCLSDKMAKRREGGQGVRNYGQKYDFLNSRTFESLPGITNYFYTEMPGMSSLA